MEKRVLLSWELRYDLSEREAPNKVPLWKGNNDYLAAARSEPPIVLHWNNGNYFLLRRFSFRAGNVRSHFVASSP